jgi:uncharacterized membrane protein YphA (DoxX/SURF4 family)
MIVAIIVGGAILIGAFLLFGPVGLVFALVGALLFGWLGSGNNMTDQQKQEHNDNIKETFYDIFGANKK